MISIASSPLRSLRTALASGEMTPRIVTEQALGRINSNAGRNVYLALDGQRTLQEAELLTSRFSSTPRPLLYGVPVSLKDCFDLAGFPTTCGSRFYATRHGFADEDSAVAAA